MLWWILLAIALLIVLCLVSFVRVSVSYTDGVVSRLHYLCFSYCLYPKKERRRKTKRRRRNSKPTQPSAQGVRRHTTRELLNLGSEIYQAFRVLPNWFLVRMRIRLCTLNVVVCAEDAATTALLTGAVQQGLDAANQFLTEHTNYSRKQDGSFFVVPGYTAERSSITVHLEFRLRLWHVIVGAIKSLTCYLQFKHRKENQEVKEEAVK